MPGVVYKTDIFCMMKGAGPPLKIINYPVKLVLQNCMRGSKLMLFDFSIFFSFLSFSFPEF